MTSSILHFCLMPSGNASKTRESSTKQLARKLIMHVCLSVKLKLLHNIPEMRTHRSLPHYFSSVTVVNEKIYSSLGFVEIANIPWGYGKWIEQMANCVGWCDHTDPLTTTKIIIFGSCKQKHKTKSGSYQTKCIPKNINLDTF